MDKITLGELNGEAGKRGFDLEKFPAGVRDEMEGFVRERGEKLRPSSLKDELFPFGQLGKFLNSSYPGITSFLDVPREEMELKAKAWLLANGKRISMKHYRAELGKDVYSVPPLVSYVRKVYHYLEGEKTEFDFSCDRWMLDSLPFETRQNPVKPVKSVSFAKIKQEPLKREMKETIWVHLSGRSLSTVRAEITAVNRFSAFLAEHYPEASSFPDVTRGMLEDYLCYTATDAKGRKSYATDLKHLKGVFSTAGRILKSKTLAGLFVPDDIPKEPEHTYVAYSDAEVKRLNAAIIKGDPQVARALFLHQMLGLRISETLSLKQDAIREKDGMVTIRVRQQKSRREYEKPVNGDVRKLFDAACAYTAEHFGKREYVFVDEKEPTRPMSYARVQYRLMAMIRENDLRDDKGQLFTVGTHIWRHCYGKRLTEMHVDDLAIAKMLGHANTDSLRFYRRIGDGQLADETREMREGMDERLKEILSGWDE